LYHITQVTPKQPFHNDWNASIQDVPLTECYLHFERLKRRKGGPGYSVHAGFKTTERLRPKKSADLKGFMTFAAF